MVGGPQVPLNIAARAVSQRDRSGRWSVIRWAENVTLAGARTSLRRIVAVVALASPVPAIVAAARVRLNAMSARTSHAAFAVHTPDGKCANALFCRSTLICTITARPRWVLSAVTVTVRVTVTWCLW